MAQHALGVVAGRRGFLDDRLARCAEAGEHHGGLDLGRGDRQAVADRQGVGAADDRQRHGAAFAGQDARAHALQRLGDPLHGADPQRGVAGQHRLDAVARDHSHQQPRAGPGVAQVEHVVRLDQAAQAAAPDVPDAVGTALDLGAHGPHGRRAAQHVLALEQPLDPALADGETGEQEGAVRDRLVAGDGGGALQALGGVRGQLCHGPKWSPM